MVRMGVWADLLGNTLDHTFLDALEMLYVHLSSHRPGHMHVCGVAPTLALLALRQQLPVCRKVNNFAHGWFVPLDDYHPIIVQ